MLTSLFESLRRICLDGCDYFSSLWIVWKLALELTQAVKAIWPVVLSTLTFCPGVSVYSAYAQSGCAGLSVHPHHGVRRFQALLQLMPEEQHPSGAA
jgi:hypothetical protein